MITPHPNKLYLEVTTRCNLRCPMCPKFAEGSAIAEADLPLALFRRLLPSLAGTRMLVLNGLGEPLLHPELETMVALARAAMPAAGRIGFQSNGLLLSRTRAERLLRAGLDVLCLSLDDLRPEEDGGPGPESHQLAAVERALGRLAEAKAATGRPVRTGAEIVLQTENFRQLPALIDWAHGHGVDFLIASHLFAYDGGLGSQSLFNPNSDEATRLFARRQAEARAQGLDLADLKAARLRFVKRPMDTTLLAIGEAMAREARQREIPIHLDNLIAWHGRDMDEVEAIFRAAGQRAMELGVSLDLPPLRALHGHKRACPFIEARAACIDVHGRVMPCHFLWHACPGMVNRTGIQVAERSFGRIGEAPLAAIWQGADFTAFRAEAGRNDYAPCFSCASAPCGDLVNANILDMHDCYGSRVPCGHCPWGIGWLKCL